MSEEELKAELERLRSENAALKRGVSSGFRLKVSWRQTGNQWPQSISG
jgi:hypothetical protein